MYKKLLMILIFVLTLTVIISCDQKPSNDTFVVTFRGQYVQKFDVKVESGDTVKKPIDPKYDGKIFLYWATEEGDRYDFETPVTDNIVLYAVWDTVRPPKKEFIVRFYGVNKQLINEQKVAYGESAVAPAVEAADFFVLDGWDRSFNRVYEDMNIYIKQRYVGSDSEIFTYSKNIDRTYTITGIKSDAVLPRTPDGYLKLGLPVRCKDGAITAIADGNIQKSAFGGLNLISVYIPSNYKRIGAYAFYNNPDLSDITLCEGLEVIGEGAFMASREGANIEGAYVNSGSKAYLSAYTDIKIPASVEAIGSNAFNHVGGRMEKGNYVMKNATLTIAKDSKLRSIGEGAFEGVMLGEINLANVGGKLSIGDRAFAADTYLNWVYSGSYEYPCSRVTKLTLPSGVSYIGERAFYAIGTNYSYYSSGWNLTDIDVEFNCGTLNLEGLGDHAFYRAGLIGELDLTAPRVGEMAFYGHRFTRINVSAQSIGSYAFAREDDKTINSTLTLKDVVSIDNGAFRGNLGLDSIRISDSLSSLGDYAFADCRSVRGEMTLPSSLSRIGNCAFLNCGIERVELLGDTKLGRECFMGSGLKELKGTPAEVGYATFMNCANLTSVTLPDNMVEMPALLFSGCKSLKEIALPQSLNIIGRGSFDSCSSLKEIDLPQNVVSIGSGAFENCSELADVTFEGESLDTVDDFSFAFCKSLSSIDLPGSVRTIGNYAFQGSALTSFKTPASLESMGWRVFYQEEYIVRGSSSGGMFENPSQMITKYTLPQIDTLLISRETGRIAFDSLGTFDGSSIVRFEVEDGNQVYSSIDGMLCSYDRKKLIKFIGDISSSSIVVPDELEEIGERAFLNNQYIINVTLPKNLKTIGDYSFYNCGRLQTIEIPQSVQTIGKYAFAGNENNLTELKTLKFANGCELDSIGDGAFEYNRGLTSLKLPENITTLGENAFAYAKNLASVDFSNTLLESTGRMTFAGCASLKNINFGDLIAIDYGAFSDCASLAEVTIGGSIETIGSRAFRNCTALKKIIVPVENSLLSIGSYAFAGNNAQKVNYGSVDLKNAVRMQKIESYAFAYGNVTSVVLPNASFSLGDGAFTACDKLTDIELGGATSIGENVFEYCSSLLRLNIPHTVTSIAKDAFRSLNLTYVQIGSPEHGITHLTIGKNSFFDCKQLKRVDIYGNVAPVLSDFDDNQSFHCFDGKNNMRVIGGLVICVDRGMKNIYTQNSYSGWSVYSNLLTERT